MLEFLVLMSGIWRNRIVTHLGLGLLSVLFCYLAYLLMPASPLNVVLADGLGYVALLLLIITLLIGPVNLWRKRKNPVNINLRRDTGIWSGITALLHVFFAFQLYGKGDLLLYFFDKTVRGYRPQINLFGFSNDVGLLATLVILVLLLLSNNLSLKLLKGKRWKFIQRFNYPLLGLVLVHTIGYQLFNERDGILYAITGALVLVTVAAQGAGIAITLKRERERKATFGTGTFSQVAAPAMATAYMAQEDEMPRRRFVAIVGGTVLAGLATGLLLRPILFREDSDAVTRPQASFGGPQEGGNTGGLSGNPSNPFGRGDRNSGFGGRRGFGTNPGSGNSRPSFPGQNPGGASSGNQGSGNQSSGGQAAGGASSGNGTVLANVNSLPNGAVKQFSTPDTGENAFLVRESDGSVKAFSGVCTHRPYDLVYDKGQNQFYCSLHGACFEVQNGDVTRRPARSALPALKVQVDNQGNIIYTAA